MISIKDAEFYKMMLFPGLILNSAGLYVSYYGNECGVALFFREPMATWGAGSWSDLPVTLYLTSLFNLDFESCLSFRTLFFPVTRDCRNLAGSNTGTLKTFTVMLVWTWVFPPLSPPTSGLDPSSQYPLSRHTLFFLRACIRVTCIESFSF